MDRITLHTMRFFTHVGCTREERQVGQHIEMDFDAYMDVSRADDHIERTLDYAAAYRAIRATVENAEVNLIETIAERAAAAVLTLGAHAVVVRVRAPAPPTPGPPAPYRERTHRPLTA